jgi:hypothetical protein
MVAQADVAMALTEAEVGAVLREISEPA